MRAIKLLVVKLLKSTGREPLKNIVAITSIFILVTLAGGLFLAYVPDFGVKEQAAAYDEIAQNLAEGRGFVWQDGSIANETPGYPYFLAIIYFIIGHNYTAVKIIQLLALGLIGVSVYFICKRLNLKFIFSVLAALVTALWPYFLLYNNLILPEILLTLLLAVTMYLLLLFQKSPSYLKSASLGIILGLAALTRPMFLLLPFFLAAGIVIFIQKFRQPKCFFKLLVLIIAFIITLTPWTIRNYVEFKELTPVKSEISNIAEEDEAVTTAIQEQAPSKQSGTFYLKNVYLFWNPGAAGKQAKVITDKYPKADYLILSYKIIFFCILALALSSLKFLKEKKVLLLWLGIAYFWAGYIFVSPLPRYTLPVIPITIALACFGLNHLMPFLCPKKKRGT